MMAYKKFVCSFVFLMAFQVYAFAEHTNVVLILIDDISHFGVSSYGAESVSFEGFFKNAPIETPRIDSLARDGLICNYAYTYPLCENTRVALMSGQDNRRNFLRPKSQHASDITFGDLFSRAGYETCIVGKWKQTRGTKEIQAKDYIFEFGWKEFFCFDVIKQVGRRMIEPNFVLNGQIKNYRGIDPATGRRWYGPDLINRYALGFMERKRDKPFFLYYSMHLVHAEHTPTPDTNPDTVYDDYDVNKPGNGRMKGDDRRYYPDMIAYTDKMVGQVLDKLESLQLANNTLVLVMGDNGSNPFTFKWHDGSVQVGGKGTYKDAGLRVPLLMRLPKSIPAGAKYDGLVYVTDILPMLCDATEVEIPKQHPIDGISFWSQATGNLKEEHRDSICTWCNGNNHVSQKEFLQEYAFDKKFKRYALDAMYPEGRFFEWHTDIAEEAGAPERKKVPKRWNRYRYAGLDVGDLNPSQKMAYARLGKILAEKKYVSVEKLNIVGGGKSVKVGQPLELNCNIRPPNATRTGVIWESSDEAVATIDKFGVLTAHKQGQVTVNIYSWDDADPCVSEREPTFFKSRIKDSVKISVTAK